MNSIEIAEKLIDENNRDIEDFRNAETTILNRIAEYTRYIEKHEKLLENAKRALAMAEEDLQRTRNLKKEYLVDNLALKLLIAEGGGLDMLD